MSDLSMNVVQDFCTANHVSLSYVFDHETKEHRVCFFRNFDGNLAAPRGSGVTFVIAFENAVRKYRHAHAH